MFAGSFAPAGWMFCEGQLLPISENDALFVLIGTTYGGDGEETFALPNLASRVPIHMGTGSAGTTYQIGEMAGVEDVTLSTGSANSATSPTPGAQVYAASDIYTAAGVPQLMNAQCISVTGGSQPHTNVQPFLAVSFIISLFGIFPSQT
jgi:microcystin-dependent protein